MSPELNDQYLTKIGLQGEVPTGHWDNGVSKKRERDSLKKHLVLVTLWPLSAAKWESWYHTVHCVVFFPPKNECKENNVGHVITATILDQTFPFSCCG